MSALLDTLLGFERTEACAQSDGPLVHASVARDLPDVLVLDLGTRVVLEPKNEHACDWLAEQLPADTPVSAVGFEIDRGLWLGIYRSACNAGITVRS
jgi:hypothetical protein